MEKHLTIKHLAGYLPYGLKALYSHTNKIGQISNIYTIGNGYTNDDIKLSIDYSDGEHIWMYKPILRPLSDLTKEIEVNGEKFIPIEEFGDFNGFYSTNLGDRIYFDELTLEDAITLHEWHFDIYGLIEAGLAVDINTLKEKEL